MLPVTTDCPFLPVQGPLTTEKSTAWFTPTPLFSPLNPFFRKPAHVSFIIHIYGFQGLSGFCFFCFFNTLSMDERFFYLFIMSSVALFCSSIHSSIQVKSNFFHSKRRADRRNQSWLFRKKPLCSLLNQLVTFHYDKLNRINKTSNELFNSKYNRGTCPNAAGFWIALEMNGGHYSVCKLVDVCIVECMLEVAFMWHHAANYTEASLRVCLCAACFVKTRESQHVSSLKGCLGV